MPFAKPIHGSRSAHAAVSEVCADALLNKALNMCRKIPT